MCGHATRARSLDGCSRQVIQDRCTVSLAYVRCFYIRGVPYVPVYAGVRVVQDRLTGAHVRGFGTSVQCPSRVPDVSAYVRVVWHVPMCAGE